MADFLSGAAMGASAGAPLGPWGIAGGAVIGGLASLFSPKPKEAPKWVNPYQNQIDYQINSLQNSSLGREAAGQAAGSIRGQALDTIESFEANPAFAGNAAVQSAAYGNIMRESERGIAGAVSQGAQIDQQAKVQGAQLAQQSAAQDLQAHGMQRQEQMENNKPSALEQLLLTAGSYGLGRVLGGSKDKGDDDTVAVPPLAPEVDLSRPAPQAPQYQPYQAAPFSFPQASPPQANPFYSIGAPQYQPLGFPLSQPLWY